MSTSITQWTTKKYFMVLFLMYAATHGGVLLIPNAIYWDDWTLYRVPSDVILETFRQAGSMFNVVGYLHIMLLGVGPWLYKVLTFVLMFCTGVCLDLILRRYHLLEKETRFLIVILFLILPFYWARVALIDIGYTICYFLFFLAWALVDRNRLISLLLFFLSFNTNSLLVFYALPFFDMYYRASKGTISLGSLVKFSIQNIDYFLLPFLFFAIKSMFFSPFGLYEGYNEQYSLKNLLLSPPLMLIDWFRLQIPIFSVLSLGALLCLLAKKFILFNGQVSTKPKVFIFIGISAFFLGSFPYFILGHVPTFAEWSSRHQILLPFGASLLLVGLLGLLEKEAKIICISFFISISFSLNFITYRDFFLDWHKQRELISLMQKSGDIREADIIVFSDNTTHFNAIKRMFRPYEWNGLMVTAFNDESRFGLSRDDFEMFLRGELFNGYFSSPYHYKMSDFRLSSSAKVVHVTIDRSPTRLIARFRRLGLPEFKLSTLTLPTPSLPTGYLSR